MELWNYPLTYYCEPGREPFFSITALPREKSPSEGDGTCSDHVLKEPVLCGGFPGIL